MKIALKESRKLVTSNASVQVADVNVTYGFRAQGLSNETTGIVIESTGYEAVRTMDSSIPSAEIFRIQYNVMGSTIDAVSTVAEQLEAVIATYNASHVLARVRLEGQEMFSDIDGYNLSINTVWTLMPGAATELGY
jgi:hypothetical protein